MQYSKWEYQNIALAAIAECAALVESLAVKGAADESAMAVCVGPLLNFSPSSVAEVYPNISQLSLGLRTLQEVFGNEKADRTAEITRYLLGILALRQKLMTDSAMQDKVQRKLDGLSMPEDASSEQEINQFYQHLANVYQQTISTYTFRIHVIGNMEFLKDDVVANKIRALLLAGIRSAVLWYQLGGRRWHLILYRKKIRETSSQIRRNLITRV
jgi:high frequency lysogenization protein